LGKGSLSNLAFIPVFNPHTHKCYILRYFTNIAYISCLCCYHISEIFDTHESLIYFQPPISAARPFRLAMILVKKRVSRPSKLPLFYMYCTFVHIYHVYVLSTFIMFMLRSFEWNIWYTWKFDIFTATYIPWYEQSNTDSWDDHGRIVYVFGRRSVERSRSNHLFLLKNHTRNRRCLLSIRYGDFDQQKLYLC